MIVSETQPMQIVTFNLRYLNAVELKRVMLQSSTVRVTRSLKGEEGGHIASTTPDSKLLRCIVSYLPKLTAIELEQIEEHAKQLVITMPLQQPQHVQTEKTIKSDKSTLVPSNVSSKAPRAKSDEAADWQRRVLNALNMELKLHLAKQPLDEDWTLIMLCYIKQARPVPSNVPCQATPPRLNEAAKWPRRVFMALNTELKLHLEKQSLDEDWTNITVSYIEQAAVKIRRASPFRLMDLPVEIRHLIYGLVVTPQTAEAHVKKNKIPTLFQISHKSSSDFAAFYYSRKVFKVELLDPSTLTWKGVVKPVRVQAMFEHWSGCSLSHYDMPVARLKGYAELHYEQRPSCDTSKKGMVRWIGGPRGKGVSCRLTENATPKIRGARMQDQIEQKAWLEKRKRIAAL